MIPKPPKKEIILLEKMAHGYYDEAQPNRMTPIAVEERFEAIDREILATYTDELALAEAKRCMSCGMCFDCGTCWSLCQDQAIIKPLEPGVEYKYKMEFCNGCKKCAENCPCGFIEMH